MSVTFNIRAMKKKKKENTLSIGKISVQSTKIIQYMQNLR